MDFIIDHDIFKRFPDSITGVVFAHSVNNTVSIPPEELRSVENHVRTAFAGLEAPSRHPNILAWRKAFKAFWCDPQKYRCSAEALVRQVLKGNSVWGINPLVDIYNFISLKYVVPVGGEDMRAIVGNLHLASATGKETFICLGSTENDPPEPGEVIYRDDAGVICRRWNWREAERTKLTQQTTDAVIVVDALAPLSQADVEHITAELAVLIQHYCGGTVQHEVRAA